MSEFWIRVGNVDRHHLIASVHSVKCAARSLLRVNRSEAVGKEWLVAVLQKPLEETSEGPVDWASQGKGAKEGPRRGIGEAVELV